MEQVKYDVFISYSRKDYVEKDQIIPGNPISAIIELFDKNSITYWIDREGIYAGTKFVEVISDAIASSKMMVFVSSINSNNSIYTAGEILEAFDGNKLVIPVLIDGCKYNSKFGLLLKPLHFIDYKAQPHTALPELLRTVNGEKKRIEKEEADKKEKQAILNAKNNIKEKAKEFHALTGQQDSILQELYAKNKLIGNTTKHCPVCGNMVPIQSSFCDKCSWQFPKLYSLDGNEIPIYDETQLALALTHWQALSNTARLDDKYKELEGLLHDSETKRKELEKSCAELKKKLDAFNISYSTSAQANEILVIPVDEKVSFKMIRVEGGDMGTFYIGETQVTQAVWQAVMGENPSYFKSKGLGNPVERVSWNDICGKDGTGTDPNCFLFKLNQKTGKKFRLPKEAEWEYAAKGGNKSSNNYIYAGSNDIDKVAWYDGNSEGSTHTVKRLSPNELSIYDMSGNVWELCEGLYEPSGSPRVLRGGGWGSDAGYCCVSSRDSIGPSLRYVDIGFRLVLPL